MIAIQERTFDLSNNGFVRCNKPCNGLCIVLFDAKTLGIKTTTVNVPICVPDEDLFPDTLRICKSAFCEFKYSTDKKPTAIPVLK